MKTMLAVLVTAVLLTMTGCGPEYRAPEDSKASGGDDTQSSISATMSEEEIGARAVVMVVREDPATYPTLSLFSDDGLMRMAGLVCSGFNDGMSSLTIVGAVAEGALIDPMEAAAFVGASVGGRCPEYMAEVTQAFQ